MISVTKDGRSLSFDSAAVFKTTPLLSALPELTAFVEALLEKADCPVKVCMQVDVAIDEVFSNIAQYSGASSAEVRCLVQDGLIALRFSDDGMAYDPLQAPDPDLSSSLDERPIGGLGIFMVKKSMDSVEYAYEDKRNVLTITKQY